VLREKNFSDTNYRLAAGRFLSFNEQGRFLRWNKNFEKVTGYSTSEMQTISLLIYFMGDDKKIIGERFRMS